MSQDPTSESFSFGGTARLFPLPNVVLFPRALLPLHIFEPRYRRMTADALADDRLIAMALLQPGWEADYEGRPAIYPVVCLGKILAEQRLEDGKFNLLLRGMSRARVSEELDPEQPYRRARLQLLGDLRPVPVPTAERLRRELIRVVPAWLAEMGVESAHLDKLFHGDLSVAGLTDVLSYALPLDVAFKQELLAELDAEQRARRLLEHLRQHPGPGPGAEPRFPPEFSPN